MRVAELLQGLVAVPSPTGHEDAAVAWLAAQAEADGWRVRVDAVGNLVLEAGPRGAPELLLLGHIDTVPGGPPCRVADGVLWGRGSVDAKGPLAAAYAAGLELAAAGVRVRLVAAVGEEGDSRGARSLVQGPPPAAAIILEPSGWDTICLGYKGILRGTLRLSRPAVHPGHPDQGAADALVSLWSQTRAALGLAAGFGHVSGRLDRVHSHHDGDRDEVEADVQLRLPPHVAPTEAAAALRTLAQRHGAAVHMPEAVPAVVCDPRSGLATALRAAIRAHGGAPRQVHKTGTADLNHAAAAWPHVPMCAYGPGDSTLDHTPHEHVRLAHVERAVRVLLHAGLAWHADAKRHA